MPNLERLVDEISARPTAECATTMVNKRAFNTELDEKE